jgi:hypothetical protein
VLGPCYNYSAQWVYNRTTKEVVHQASGLCLDIAWADPTPGTPVSIFGCHGGANQQWTYNGVSGMLTSGIGTALDIQAGNFQPNTPVWSYSPNGGDAQRWWADQPFNVEPEWQSTCGLLQPGEGLVPYAGAWSCDGRFQLQNYTPGDGVFRLVQWDSGTSITRWQSPQWSGFPGVLVMQGDGNLVLYDSLSAFPMWASNTAGNPGVSLSIQNDGNLVIYENGSWIWQSYSCCH